MVILKQIIYIIFVSLFLPFLCILFNVLNWSVKISQNFILYLYDQEIGKSESFISLSAAFLTAQAIFEAPRQSLISWFVKRTTEGVYRTLGNEDDKIRQILMSSSMAKELDDREVALTEKCKNSKYLEVLAFLSVIVGASYWIMLYLKCCNKLGFFSLLGFIPFFLYLIKVWSICKENENSLIENIKDKSDKYSPFLGKQVSSIIQNMKTKMEEEQNGNAEDSHYGCCPFRASCPHCPKNLTQ